MGIDHRLTTRQMAEFVANGFIRFDAIVPPDVNERGIDEMRRLELERFGPVGLKPPHTVGASPLFDHDFTHHLQPHSTYTQPLHVDAITDSPDTTFDVQLFWYPHVVAPGEGGTRFVPGSHLRRVRSSGLDRYQHIAGEQQFSGPAGTVVVFHHGLWHAGQPNPGDGDRWMHKVRLNPTVAQVRLWNLDDLVVLQNPPSDHVFARMLPDSVAQILRTMHPWMSVTDYRNEQVQRAKLWRYLTGDDTYDVDHYLTRLEGRAVGSQHGRRDRAPRTDRAGCVVQSRCVLRRDER